MIARFGDACARWAERTVPHPFVFALVLSALVLAAGLVSWDDARGPALAGVLEAWYEGFWSTGLLAFGFQMSLILVTGYAVADAPLVRAGLARLATLWKSPAGAVALVATTSVALSWLHWGLGLVGAAFLAREVGRASIMRGIPIPYPLVAASAYAGFLAWHGGLSGSAPLVVAQPDHPQAELVGAIPVTQTIFAPQNLALAIGLLVAVPLAMALMARSAPVSLPRLPPEELEEGAGDPESVGAGAERERPMSLAERAGRSPLIAALAVLPAIGVLVLVLVPEWRSGARSFDLNAVLFLFLLGGLALHASPVAMARSLGRGAGEVGGILLQFPFYFALLGVMRESGLVARLAEAGVGLAASASEAGIPAGWAFQTLTFLFAGLVNLFVPSGGGQWAVQGEIVLRAALDPAIGVEPARAVLALAYGDAWTNMLQPFWALALLSVTRTKAREILGYTLALMILVFPLYLIVFAF